MKGSKRTHGVLGGSVTKVLKAFHLKMKDLPERVPHLVDSGVGLDLPDRLSSFEVRQIGASAIISHSDGCSLGDILLWLDTHLDRTHVDPPVSYSAFCEMVYATDRGVRYIYNRKSVSNCYTLAERVAGLSWVHHDRVRLKGLSQRERLKLLHQAAKEGWSDTTTGDRATERLLEVLKDDKSADAQLSIVRIRTGARVTVKRLRTVFHLLLKSNLSAQEAAVLERERPIMLEDLDGIKELLGHRPMPPLKKKS